jgi:enoyl-CoA hydratase/carnithine racemase
MTSTSAGRGPTMTDVTVTVDGDVAVIVLRRPPHNLLTEAVLHEVADIVHGLPGQARAAVIGADGRSFCAGADFRSGDAPDPTDEEAFETQTGAFYAQAARLYESPVPLVAAVQGAAIGAGFGLALACDIRVVGAGGWFQANFVRLGIHPGFALSAVLPLVIGPARATDLFLTGRRLAADEALAIGLAQKLVDSGDEMTAAVEIATQIASGAPLAVASTRATLRQGLGATARAAMRHELAEQTALAGTADAVEGVHAMLEGRPPRFSGR